MKKKKTDGLSNYLEKIPVRPAHINWTKDEEGLVTIEIENKGVFNRVAQMLLKKPKITYIHFDEMGSFLWPLLDGKKDIVELGKMVKDNFGDKAEPLYERLAKYFQILDSYRFVEWQEEEHV